jgi:formyltetrahydrofolate deformylase
MTETPQDVETGRLLVRCEDRPGIVAAVSRFLYLQGANIAQSDQYSTDPEGGTFFLRMVFHMRGLAAVGDELRTTFTEQVAHPFGMTWSLQDAARPKRVAVLVSREDHCLLDLLWRWRRRRHELETDIVAVISNHPDHERDVAGFGVPYHHAPYRRTARPKPRHACSSYSRATSSWSCSPATCRSSPESSSSGSACR